MRAAVVLNTTSAKNCKECPVGTYADQSGGTNLTTTCKSCDVGRFQSLIKQVSESSCVMCPTGYYQFFDRQGACAACPIGYYQEEDTKTDCKDCPIGFYGDEEALDQLTDSLNNLNRCKECEIGLYGDEYQLSSYRGCKDCSAGRYSVYKGQTSDNQCTACVSGKYSTESGCFSEDGCYKGVCPGNYTQGSHVEEQTKSFGQDRFCLTSCTPCPKGRWSSRSGANSSVTCEACPVGRYLDAKGGIVSRTAKHVLMGDTQILRGKKSALSVLLDSFLSFAGKAQLVLQMITMDALSAQTAHWGGIQTSENCCVQKLYIGQIR